MRIQPDLNFIPDIGPSRMVIGFLCKQRNARHECERFTEIGELELLIKAIIFFFPHVLDFLKDKMFFVSNLFIGQLCYKLYPADLPDRSYDLFQGFIVNRIPLHEPQEVQVFEFG